MNDTGRPLSELRDDGLLWLINVTVFHPRGYSLALHYERDDDNNVVGEPTGWSLVGDGTEPWTVPDTPEIHELARRAKALMP